MRQRLGWVVIAAVVLLAAACSGTVPSPSGVRLTLFVASSLDFATDALTHEYMKTNPTVEFTKSTGSSTALRTQIEQGAPADVLLSADAKNPQALADEGLASGAAVTFASNSLAIVVPKGNPAGVTSAADLGRSGLRIVAAGDAVPITGYVTQLLTNLVAMPGVPADLAARYAANVVSREEDVKSVLSKIELGEADAAIVYATDAESSTQVDTVPIPAPPQVKASYSGVTVKTSANLDQAAEFLGWLDGPYGGSVLAGFGFSPP
jgi:molybdate transport system substrate-binding protein